MAKRKHEGDPPSPPTRARVLMACIYGQPDDIVTLSDTELDQAVDFGMVDPDPAAVAYAESLAAPVDPVDTAPAEPLPVDPVV